MPDALLQLSEGALKIREVPRVQYLNASDVIAIERGDRRRASGGPRGCGITEPHPDVYRCTGAVVGLVRASMPGCV